MPVEPGVLDANVLAYALNADAPQHTASRALLEAACDPAVNLYVTSQILCELYSLITNPRRFPAASSSKEALSIISEMLALPGLQVLPTPARAVAGWMELLQRRPVRKMVAKKAAAKTAPVKKTAPTPAKAVTETADT